MLIGAESQSANSLSLRERFGSKFKSNPEFDAGLYSNLLKQLNAQDILKICNDLLAIPKLLELPSLALHPVKPWRYYGMV
jgi:hypothetical protein